MQPFQFYRTEKAQNYCIFPNLSGCSGFCVVITIFAPPKAPCMANDQRSRKKILKKLKNKYRLVILHESTFAEKFSMLLSPLNVIIVFTLFSLFIILMVLSVIVFTPLKEFIPGYADTSTQINAIRAAEAAAQLEEHARIQEQYLANLRRVLQGDVFENDTLELLEDGRMVQEVSFSRSLEDSLLRLKVEETERYNIAMEAESVVRDGDLTGMFFFTPLRGEISSSFDPSINHLGVDIVSRENEAVKAVLDGTVVLATWTTDGGFTIQLQHRNNLVSVYKHNSVLLKKEGDRVKAGDPIAIVGNSGELTDGPHLHFELWHKGKALDPEKFMVFN
ncbi:MAG: M23 family metallopeptidase [Cryomorphaceae bacterium]|nr:MAG: M23 family metallopeptidase [Cryomorphaceae bacterium]